MGQIEPLDLMENEIDDEMLLLDEDRAIIEFGASKGVTIPPAAQKNADFEGSAECYFDPSSGAVVLLPGGE